MAHHQLIYKEPDANLRRKYKKWLEGALVISLILVTSLFYAFQRFDAAEKLQKQLDTPLDVVIIPPTEQLEKPPKPERPKIPVEAKEDADVPDDVTIDEIISFTDPIDNPGPPPEEEEPIVPFYAVSDKPKIIKQVTPLYPELAKKAGIEGTVVIKVLVGIKGDVEKVEVFKSHPLLDEAAVKAAWQCKFKPGKQRDKFVKVWMSIPFHFKLK